MAYKNNNSPQKSKYLRDPGEKKQSKYLRDKKEGKPKSKYARDPREQKEHHYNLTRNYRDGVKITDEQPEEAIEAVEVEAVNSEAAAEKENIVLQQNEVVEIPDEKSKDEAVSQDNAVEEIEENINETTAEVSEFVEESDEEAASPETADSENASENKSETKGDITSIFQHSKLSKETTVAKVENEEDTKQQILVKSVIVMFILTAIACALQFASIRIKIFTPSMLNMEFSLLPEFIASLAYGPVFGIIIIIIKNIVYSLVTASISNLAYASALSGVILDTVFVVLGGSIYTKRMFGGSRSESSRRNNRVKYRKKVFNSGVIATAATTIVSYFLTTYVTYPLIIKQFASKGIDEYFILRLYQYALNNLNSVLPSFLSGRVSEFANLNQGILFYNMPLTVLKLLFITAVAVIIYPPLSPYIHFRKKTK